MIQKKTLKNTLASKLFEFLDLGKGARENFAIQILIQELNLDYEPYKVDNDPPDYIFMDNGLKIACEVTEIHINATKKGAPYLIRLNKYHRLLKALKASLGENGYGKLYGIFHLIDPHNCAYGEKFIEKEYHNKFVEEVIQLLKNKRSFNEVELTNNEFTDSALLKQFIKSIKIYDYSNRNESDFYWWFSHLQSGRNATPEINVEDINKIIEDKCKKLSLKLKVKNYKENWLVIYTTDFGLQDIYQPPKNLKCIEGRCFDKVYFISTFFGLTKLFDIHNQVCK